MITTKDILHLASLARIEMTEEEAVALTPEIDSILGYVGQIKNSVGDIEHDVPALRNVLRDDVVTHSAGEYTEDLLGNVPSREGQYLKVKKIL